MGDKQISAISWKQKLPLRRWKLIGQELEVKCIEKLILFNENSWNYRMLQLKGKSFQNEDMSFKTTKYYGVLRNCGVKSED